MSWPCLVTPWRWSRIPAGRGSCAFAGFISSGWTTKGLSPHNTGEDKLTAARSAELQNWIWRRSFGRV